MPENGDEKELDKDKEAVTVTFTRKHLDFLDRLVRSGGALSRPDAVRTILNRVIEMEG